MQIGGENIEFFFLNMMFLKNIFKDKSEKTFLHASLRKTLSLPQSSHWLHETSISKIVCHHFQPGLINWGHLFRAGGGCLG